MNIDQATKEIDKLKTKLRTELAKDIVNIISQDIVSMIENRVRDKGKDANGASFGPYSRKPMLTSGTTLKSRRVWRAMAGTKKKRNSLNWVTIKKGGKNIHLFELKGGYAQLRKLEGFTNKSKSFEFTGEMWRKFGVVRVSATSRGVTVTIGGKTTASQDKIDWNSEREGRSIIDISKQELKYLEDKVDKFIQGYIVNVNLN